MLQHRGVKRHRHKQRRHTALDRDEKDIADLQADEERVRHDHGVVVGVDHHVAVAQVEVREEHADVTDEDGAHGEDGVDQAFVDERVDAAVFHHVPGGLGGLLAGWFSRYKKEVKRGEKGGTYLGSGNVRLSVQRNITKRILVEELHQPVEETNQAPKDTEHDLTNHVPLRCRVLLRNIARLTQQLDNSHNQAAKANRAKAVRDRALERAARSALGESSRLLRAKVPRAVDAGDGDVDDVLEDLGDPVPRKGDEDDEPDDLGGRAAAVGLARRVAGVPARVHGDQGYGEPGAEGGGDDAADEGDDEDVAVVLGNIDDGLEHQH
ncbi:hypothetical protein V494_05100 [Pseudogymnoascus sp. VKM F-4513 (FW-928)]|nr:hypothetical protein V494_05100 [Pseudogymnoascus sp. VKM F-4513 (FW-928)]